MEALLSITIPANVEELEPIGNLASLVSLKVDENNTKYDSRDDCNAVIETETNKLVMGCKTTVIPDGITVIGRNAFGGRWGLENIYFPSTIRTIEKTAFSYNINLKNIKLPSGLETIEGGRLRRIRCMCFAIY